MASIRRRKEAFKALIAPGEFFLMGRQNIYNCNVNHLQVNPPKLLKHFGCLSQSSILHFGRGEFCGSVTLSHSH